LSGFLPTSAWTASIWANTPFDDRHFSVSFAGGGAKQAKTSRSTPPRASLGRSM
jgi:hypothetical protein